MPVEGALCGAESLGERLDRDRAQAVARKGVEGGRGPVGSCQGLAFAGTDPARMPGGMSAVLVRPRGRRRGTGVRGGSGGEDAVTHGVTVAQRRVTGRAATLLSELRAKRRHTRRSPF